MLFKIMLDKKRAEEREKDAALCESIFGASRAHTHTHMEGDAFGLRFINCICI